MQVSGTLQYQQILKGVKANEQSVKKNTENGIVDTVEISAKGKERAEKDAASGVVAAPQKTASSSPVSVSDLHAAANRYASLARNIQARIIMDF